MDSQNIFERTVNVVTTSSVKHTVIRFVGSVAVILFTFSGSAYSQFRITSEPKLNTLEQMRQESEGSSFFTDLFDPTRLSMHQSYSFSYTSGPTGSAGLSVFTNTFAYRLSQNMQVSADLSAVYSPFSSFGDSFSKSINGVYLSNARLDWRLGDKTFLTVAYSRSPYSGAYSPFGGSSLFDNSFGGRDAFSPFHTSTVRVDH